MGGALGPWAPGPRGLPPAQKARLETPAEAPVGDQQ